MTGILGVISSWLQTQGGISDPHLRRSQNLDQKRHRAPPTGLTDERVTTFTI